MEQGKFCSCVGPERVASDSENLTFEAAPLLPVLMRNIESQFTPAIRKLPEGDLSIAQINTFISPQF
jgi:hypothetical protein